MSCLADGPAFGLFIVNAFLELFNLPHSARKLHCVKSSLPWSTLRKPRNEVAAWPHISQQMLTIQTIHTAHHALLAKLTVQDKTNKSRDKNDAKATQIAQEQDEVKAIEGCFERCSLKTEGENSQ